MQLNNIKLELIKAGMTQGELVRKLGVNKSTVNNWANNLTQPSLAKLYKVANAIGVPAPRLLRDNNPFADPQTQANEQ